MKQKEKEIKTKYMNQKHSLPPLLKRGTGVRPYLTTNCMKTFRKWDSLHEKNATDNIGTVSYTHLTLPTTPYV